MLITSRDRLEPRTGERAYALRISLPERRDAARDGDLAEHIDSFVRLYLTRFDSAVIRASRTAPLRWTLVSGSKRIDEVEKARAELETTLFGNSKDNSSGQAILVELPIEDDAGEYVPATQIGEETNTATGLEQFAQEEAGPAGPETSLRDEIAAFRADMREIAASLSGPDIHQALDSFRTDLSALAERMEGRMQEAAQRVEGAAERLDGIASRLPDADRLELALTRNDTSAAIISSGFHESLRLLLKAVEGLERETAARRAEGGASGAGFGRAAA